MWYVTPDGALVDENDRMPGDSPYNPSSGPTARPGPAVSKPMDRIAGQIARHGGANSAVAHRRNPNARTSTTLVPPTPDSAAYHAATSTMPLNKETPLDSWKRMGEYLKRMSTQRPDKWSWRS